MWALSSTCCVSIPPQSSINSPKTLCIASVCYQNNAQRFGFIATYASNSPVKCTPRLLQKKDLHLYVTLNTTSKWLYNEVALHVTRDTDALMSPLCYLLLPWLCFQELPGTGTNTGKHALNVLASAFVHLYGYENTYINFWQHNPPAKFEMCVCSLSAKFTESGKFPDRSACTDTFLG